MKAYSLDFRQKIVETYDKGGISQKDLAERFCVSVFFVKKLFRQRRQKNTLAPLARKGWQKGLMTTEIEEHLTNLFKANKKLKLAEAVVHIETNFGVFLSTPTICRVVKKLNLRRKNRQSKRLEAHEIN